MRAVGFIKEKNKNAFRTPVYSNTDGEFFLHQIDEHYNIESFIPTCIAELNIKKIYLSKKIEIDSKGVVVFVGVDNYYKYDTADHAIEEIIHYLDELPCDYETQDIIIQAKTIQKKATSDRFVVDRFKVRLHPKKEQITLTFDFPAPQSDNKMKLLKPHESNMPAYAAAFENQSRVEMNIELTLRLRAHERRNTLKTFNYQFKLAKQVQRSYNQQ